MFWNMRTQRLGVRIWSKILSHISNAYFGSRKNSHFFPKDWEGRISLCGHATADILTSNLSSLLCNSQCWSLSRDEGRYRGSYHHSWAQWANIWGNFKGNFDEQKNVVNYWNGPMKMLTPSPTVTTVFITHHPSWIKGLSIFLQKSGYIFFLAKWVLKVANCWYRPTLWI